MAIRLIITLIKHQDDLLVALASLESLNEMLAELRPLALANEPPDVLNAFESWLVRRDLRHTLFCIFIPETFLPLWCFLLRSSLCWFRYV